MARRVLVNRAEVEFSAIRAQGAGGQNVNKVSSAAHLRFDVAASSLPEDVKARLLAQADQRISGEGTVVIKAQDHRSLVRNQADALLRAVGGLGGAAGRQGRARRGEGRPRARARRLTPGPWCFAPGAGVSSQGHRQVSGPPPQCGPHTRQGAPR
jgi:ribosome-associated protein